jgi:outer membrane protein OmpA-like peptidoglycan-associated protein
MIRFHLAVAAAIVALGADIAVWAQKPVDQWPKVKPADQWQVPKEFQKPGEIQIPGDIQGVRIEKGPCEQRVTIASDALFAFDKSDLTPDAVAALEKLGPALKDAAAKSVQIEGHTDSKGDDIYNQKLSERRAKSVKDWLARRNYLPRQTTVLGHGENKPVAPNAHPDGRDDPEGRQRNRRVELVFMTCG